jgi:hypothetical protein
MSCPARQRDGHRPRHRLMTRARAAQRVGARLLGAVGLVLVYAVTRPIAAMIGWWVGNSCYQLPGLRIIRRFRGDPHQQAHRRWSN